MSADIPITEVELRSGLQAGARLTLYANRVVHTAQDAFEIVPLSQLAAVGVAFQRDARKLNWAIVLVVVALILAAVSAPLRDWLISVTARLAEPGRRESLDAVLISVFNAFSAGARLLTPIAALCTLLAAGLVALFWLGMTTLTLSAGGVDREFRVRGRNLQLTDFAQAVGEQLAVRKA
jgi:hypothetical protein